MERDVGIPVLYQGASARRVWGTWRLLRNGTLEDHEVALWLHVKRSSQSGGSLHAQRGCDRRGGAVWWVWHHLRTATK